MPQGSCFKPAQNSPRQQTSALAGPSAEQQRRRKCNQNYGVPVNKVWIFPDPTVTQIVSNDYVKGRQHSPLAEAGYLTQASAVPLHALPHSMPVFAYYNLVLPSLVLPWVALVCLESDTAYAQNRDG
ncbi:hypothetical protein FPSE_03548 [Fusarium pseudograminearum CS3096]|uniref:Uncharacterized protein n=1 Tax=Fusarium pseudograminearum (strain CS3096) TaxID=1028729 RepID=K3VR06_FUSPC|nr:hypothetical protein FPSE_03548 [Fusarium pseudograminearum CS3096]EKJ76293.1 hypothetical protein FPSE_03548 [Fusarium pseudograminearum CS3096]